ncbi:MAG TPA: hypothetical protein VN493_10390 [Thermoanaerobaculia bacterium]|nr:hypothetical protein [Thermoanaerobaculia bacterium]
MQRYAWASAFATAFILLAAGASAQLEPVGSEIQVNAATPGSQAAPAAAAGPSGQHAVAWQGPGDDTDVWIQVWDADGAILLPELRVNSFLSNCQQAPALSFAPDGGFVVVWQSDGQDGSGWGIFAQRFDEDGSLAGPEFQINATTSGDQRAPAVAHGPSGSFTVVWKSEGQDGDSWGVYARRFDASGPLSGEVQAAASGAASGAGDQRRPAVTVQPTGHVVMVWEGPDGSGPGIFLRRFAPDLTAPGAEVQVNETSNGFQVLPSLAADGSGNVIIAWEHASDIQARRLDRLLAPLGSSFVVNSTTPGLQTRPRVGSSGSGDFLISWEGWSQDEGGPGAFARRFDFRMQPESPDFPLNTFVPGPQLRPALAVSPNGDVLAAWESEGQDGDGLGVFAQRYVLPGLDFHTLVPCRVFDTRSGPPLQSGTERIFQVAGICGIPVTARAVSVNLTAVNAASGGEVVMYPGDLQTPGTSSGNFVPDRARANNAILALARNGNGKLAARALVGGSGTVHLILDVNGYFE